MSVTKPSSKPASPSQIRSKPRSNTLNAKQVNQVTDSVSIDKLKIQIRHVVLNSLPSPHTHAGKNSVNSEFLAFLIIAHCEENLLFLDWINRYKEASLKLFTPESASQSHKVRFEGDAPKPTKPDSMSQTNFDDLIKHLFVLKKYGFVHFITNDAVNEVGLPSKVKNELEVMLNGTELYPIPALDEAYEVILTALKENVFAKFINDAYSKTLY